MVDLVLISASISKDIKLCQAQALADAADRRKTPKTVIRFLGLFTISVLPA
jgi:hypothetical protein